MISKAALILCVLLLGSLGRSFDRKLVVNLPSQIDVALLKDYLGQINFDGGHSFVSTPVHLLSADLVITTDKVAVENWHNDKCEEVNRNLAQAEDLFKEFKALSMRLAKLLAKDVYDYKTHEEITEVYEAMKRIQQLILKIYPEIYDTWDIRVTAHWALPTDKVFVYENHGPVFALEAISNGHYHWQKSDAKVRLPPSVKFVGFHPNWVIGRVRSVPVAYCSPNFYFSALLRVVGNNMNSLKILLTPASPL